MNVSLAISKVDVTEMTVLFYRGKLYLVQNTCQGLYSKLWFRFTGTREVDEVSHSALDFAMEMDDIGEILKTENKGNFGFVITVKDGPDWQI